MTKAMYLSSVGVLAMALTSAVGLSTVSASAAAPVSVTLMTWENPQTNDQIMKSLAKFEKQNPGIQVKLVNAPLQNYGTKLNSMLAAGRAPDIFELGNDNEQQWGAQGLLYSYTSLLDKAFLNHFYPGVIPNWTENGQIYGLPSLLNTYGVFYNKKLFAAAHLPLPRPGWTVQEMLSDAQKLMRTSGGVHTYGLYQAADDPFSIGVYSVSAGGAPFAEAVTHTSKVTVSSQFIQGLNLYRKYIKSGAVTPATFDNSNDEALFLAGKVPMLANGQWIMEQMIGPSAPKGLSWGFAPNPIVSKRSTIFDAVGWASPKHVANASQVAKVMQYLDTTQYAQTLPGAPVAPPAYQPAAGPYYHELKATGHEDAAVAIQYMLTSPNKQPVRFMETWANDANQFVNADWNKLLASSAPISLVNDMASKINSVISMNQ